MIWTWLRERLGARQDLEDTAVTLGLTCGGRIRLRPGQLEVTSPPGSRGGPITTRLELSVAETNELRAALAAANPETAATA
ncbi:hypothetical protein [Amycolatopsis albispora]|uniref:Uncharacterized protein n=1 Tax=Amycolatopsis albispora TaxID=1804986 RepID=A0A344L2W0_9PSEU|nr:hypothetical protein [Amycolatopsis albispora]AXB42384.1 hypothetical protein A4R43_07460 [Amycolatopsis albispora]